MATSLNSYATNALLSNFSQANVALGANTTLRIYPSTVPYPISPVETVAALPAGYILSYPSLSFSSSLGVLTISGGVTAQQTTAAGTLGWWVSTGNTTGLIISNSITLSGGGGILVVSTMTPTSGQSVSISLNLSIA